MTRTIALVAATLAVALLGFSWWLGFGRSTDGDVFAQCRASNVAGGSGSIGGPFTLVNGDGQTVTDADVITQPSLIYFGYTFCPDVCPLDMARNADAVDVLADMGHAAQPVFISVDPDRDTPEVVKDFASYMHPDAIGLTGSAEQVRAASQAYKTYYRKQDGDPEYYLVDHSTFTYLVLPGHGFVEFFRRDDTSEAMAERAACFIEAAQG